MVDDRDIWRVARLLVKSHGENAELRAAERLDEMLAQGDLIGRDMWRQIVAAIQELNRVTRSENERVN